MNTHKLFARLAQVLLFLPLGGAFIALGAAPSSDNSLALSVAMDHPILLAAGQASGLGVSSSLPSNVGSVALCYSMSKPPVSEKDAIVDSTGHTAGTIVGTPLPITTQGPLPKTGTGWDFAGTKATLTIPASNSVVQNIGNITNTIGMSISFWFNTDHGRMDRGIAMLGEGGVTFKIRLTGDGLAFFCGDNIVTPQFCLTSPGGEFDGKWHHYVLTMDYRNPVDQNGIAAKNVYLYVDGQEKSGMAYPFQDSFNPKESDAITLNANVTGDGPTQAKLALFAIYNIPLTEQEVSQLHTNGSIAACAPRVAAKASSKLATLAHANVTLTGSVLNLGEAGMVTAKWSLVKGPKGGTVVFGSPTTLNTTANFSTIPGTYVLGFTAVNSLTALNSTTTVTVKVVEPTPPEVYASVNGGPTATVLTGATVALSGASRCYGLWNMQGESSLWSLSSGPGRATFAAATNPNTTVSFSSPGTYVLKFSSTSESLTESTAVTVQVVDNLPPVVTASTQKQIIRWPSHSVELSGISTSTSPKGSLKYTWTQVSGAGQTSFAHADAECTTATFSEPGVYHLQLKVTDGVTTSSASVWVNIWPKVPGSDANIVPPVPRQLSQQPPPFVHPRYYFSDADRPEMAARALNDPIAREGVANVTKELEKTLLNPSVPLCRAYRKMLVGDTSYSIQSLSEKFYEMLSQACYLAWLNKDAAKLKELAAVTATAARNELTWFTDQRDVNFCLCYDLTYNSMTEDQRVDSRALIAKMSWGGGDLGNDFVYSNAGYFYSNVNSIPLAIYGEPGFNNTLADNNFKWSKVSVTTWGITQGGWGRDDIGYHGFGMSQHIATLLAFSRQYEPLHVTSRLAIGAQMEFYQYAPNTTCDTEKPEAYSHGDGAGFSQKGALYQFYKYFYPTDPLNDFVCRIARRGPGYFPSFYDAMFGEAPLITTPSYASVAAAENMPLTKFDPQRGIGTTRSDWSPNTASLDFDCRFDMFNNGHIHADRNNFTFFALGREWVNDPGFHQWASDQHATVVIDGIAQGWYTPGKFLDVIDHRAFTLFAGDATASYNYDCKYPSVGARQVVPCRIAGRISCSLAVAMASYPPLLLLPPHLVIIPALKVPFMYLATTESLNCIIRYRELSARPY